MCMLTSRKFAEKRDYIRMTMDCPVKYQSLNGEGKKEGTCLNLSAKGVLFRCNDQYPVGTMLRIDVSPRLSISPPFFALIKVLRVSSATESGYQIAGSIQEIH